MRIFDEGDSGVRIPQNLLATECHSGGVVRINGDSLRTARMLIHKYAETKISEIIGNCKPLRFHFTHSIVSITFVT